jgi:hypothetical protein
MPPSETSTSRSGSQSKPGLDSAMRRKRAIQRLEFFSRDSLNDAEFAISPQNAATSQFKVLIIKEKDSLAGEGFELPVRIAGQ